MASTTTAYPLGTYAGNPNGNDANAQAAFENQYASFESTMGTTPGTMDAFTDFTQPVSDWVSNAGWTAWSWAQAGFAGKVTPVIGIPMAASSTTDADAFFKAITAGQYDSVYIGIVDAWVAQGFTTLDLRIGYEMNSQNYMPWSLTSETGAQDWVAAFQHLSTLMKQAAAAVGATAQILWNPVSINTTDVNTASLYPGDSYVDIISTDMYSPVQPLDLYNWASNNGTDESSVAQWVSNPLNLLHWWEYPNATAADPTGAGSTSGWSLQDTIALARQYGKPLAITETGVGSNGAQYGPTDDPAFVTWLANTLAQSGTNVSFVNIWDAQVGDGNWDFSSSSATKPGTRAAWQQDFGAGSVIGTSTMVLPVSGSSTERVVIGPGNVNAILTATDIDGNSLAMPAVTSGAENWYTNQSGLVGNVHQWMTDTGVVWFTTETWNLVKTAAIGDTSGGSFGIYNFVEADATLSGASTGTPASLTIDNAKRGTISLGSGSYNVTFNALGGTPVAADNTVTVTMGSGDDTFTLQGSDGMTVADVTAGSGNDQMTFINTGSVTVTAGAGTTDVTGGSAADTYIFGADAGTLTVSDFTSAQGDVLQIASSLESAMQIDHSGGNTILTFGTGHEIILAGVTSDVSGAIKWG